MGWYATHKALVIGKGPYGGVAESLRGESDPNRTLLVALEAVGREVESGFELSHSAKIRIAYWSRRSGYSAARPNPRLQLTRQTTPRN